MTVEGRKGQEEMQVLGGVYTELPSKSYFL